MQISWPSLIAAAIIAVVVSGLMMWSFQPKVGPPGRAKHQKDLKEKEGLKLPSAVE
jgi:hypothetical protein